ncbi:DUF2254 domain-containing protein [Deinococcus metalli]|uniref:DUF2254 domain-containing protein n=2 Tax=Deinococcus metalli TaxID=1141878 RepID=A0ABQ3JPF5_9DEIO|nr:DUF2254 domain-containing protein [Deinococcus metalli]GHF45984.1 hypothetical protein GCM10017781_23010 [Deinococcus metalli]
MRTVLRLRQLTEQFWFIPAVMTVLAVVLAELGVEVEETYGVPYTLHFVYGGGGTGARSVLSAVASSSIGVAGTVFSITIAALSYAAGSMGPRLLDNFTRDRGNQITLGVFIATFAFSLYSLRAVSGTEDVPFVPHYNVTGAMLLALASVAALVYYLAHVTSSINMTRVVNLLRDDLTRTLEGATQEREGDGHPNASPPPETFWESGAVLRAPSGGYLQLLDVEALTRAATRADAAVRLYVRVGDYVFPNSVIARGVPHLPAGVVDALTVGPTRTTGQDLEYSVRQLAEVAARALSPGTNDPVTAIDVIDRFGDALCTLESREWPGGTVYVDGQLRLVRPVTDYAGLLDGMFHMIRQYGKGAPAVVLRVLEVLRNVADCTPDPARQRELRRHADLVREDAAANIENASDRRDVQDRYDAFLGSLREGPADER